jgi:hypothetical protein
MCGYSWTTAPKCEHCPECCHEMDKIEGEQPNCHFTIMREMLGTLRLHANFYNPRLQKQKRI